MVFVDFGFIAGEPQYEEVVGCAPNSPPTYVGLSENTLHFFPSSVLSSLPLLKSHKCGDIWGTLYHTILRYPISTHPKYSQISSNVVNPTRGHPQNHHFHGCYKPSPKMVGLWHWGSHNYILLVGLIERMLGSSWCCQSLSTIINGREFPDASTLATLALRRSCRNGLRIA